MAPHALAIGMDIAQARPGDALEYTAASGGAAYLLGPAETSLCLIEASLSYATDTPDFWRRAHEKYPEHGERFTGEPAYFKHITEAAEAMLRGLGTRPSDYAYVVFHQPNTKFPQRIGKTLGFKPEQIAPGLLVPLIGNTYAGSALVGLTAVLDLARPGDQILLVSYGSGAGSDAFHLVATERLVDRRGRAPSTQTYIERRTEIDYATYARFRGTLAMT
jgi:hydroxymethylglutaryl-CoA synthase